jgi:hypothetical protein
MPSYKQDGRQPYKVERKDSTRHKPTDFLNKNILSRILQTNDIANVRSIKAIECSFPKM